MKTLFICSILLGFLALSTAAQTTGYTYQGRLTNTGLPANGSYDLEFALYDAIADGTQIGTTLSRGGVAVSDGVFTVSLDFGGVFPGADRFLEIHVRQTGSPTFVVLTPRQKISSAPYAVKSLNADTATTATNTTQLGGVAADQFVVTSDTRLSDARDPLPGSTNYIQNGTSPQALSNFNISGNGTAAGTISGNLVNSATRYNIGGNRFLATGTGSGTFAATNTFAGFFAGNSDTPDPGNGTSGNFNSFFGNGAGQNNTTGFGNSFFGNLAGQLNVVGIQNSFFGFQAGNKNTGSDNVFFGYSAGFNNNAGTFNAFVGSNAGYSNTTGNANSFFGGVAGNSNTTGNSNSFFGSQAGTANTTASGNSFFGAQAGFRNITGANNSFFGSQAGFSTTIGVNNNFSGAISGYFNSTGSNNSFFGVSAGYSNTTGSANSFFGNSAGVANTTATGNSFFGEEAGYNNTTGEYNSFFGANSAGNSTIGSNNSFYGAATAQVNTTGNNNSFFGSNVGNTNTTGSANTLVGYQANLNSNNLTNATAIGANASVAQSNSLILGSINGVNGASADTNVGIGTVAPAQRLHVIGNGLFTGNLTVNGTLNANLPAGSSNYIQNGTTQQSSSNFNISGNGFVGGVVGIGTTAPSAKLHAIGGSSTGVLGASSNSIGVYGTSSSFNGVQGETSSSDVLSGAAGVKGSGPVTIGVWGNSNSGTGVYGTSGSSYGGSFSSNSGYGVYATSNTTHAIYANGSSFFNRWIVLNELMTGGGSQLCRNSSNQVSSCSSSSIRYKKNIGSFSYGLDVVRRLRPVTFDWKSDGTHDIGLVAEEVEKVAPQLSVYEKGRVEGVKYDKIGVVLINAVKEQQAQIEAQSILIETQQKIIESLRTAFCKGKRKTGVCGRVNQ